MSDLEIDALKVLQAARTLAKDKTIDGVAWYHAAAAMEAEIVRLETSLRESKEREDAARREIAEYEKQEVALERQLAKAESDADALRSTLDDMGFQETDCADCARNLKGARKVLLPDEALAADAAPAPKPEPDGSEGKP